MQLFIFVLIGRLFLIPYFENKPFFKVCKRMIDALIITTIITFIICLMIQFPTNEEFRNFTATKLFNLTNIIIIVGGQAIIALLEFISVNYIESEEWKAIVACLQFFIFFKVFYVICLLILLIFSFSKSFF